MKTVHKIAIARTAYRAIHAGRAALGLSDRCIVTRGGIRYDLDLSQGIDLAIFLGGIFERPTQNALRRLVKPGATVLDIGANIGAHTLLLAQLVGRSGKVASFEPTSYAFNKQQQNLALNPDLAARVTSHRCFLTSGEEDSVPGEIYSSWPLAGAEGLHRKHLGQAMPTDTTPARSLDSILAEMGNPTVQLVKLDVDGFECQVLSGAKKLIRESAPIFVLEISPYVLDERGASLEELLSYFLPAGYRFFHESTMKLLPQTAEGLRKIVGDGESINAVARRI